MAPRPKRPPQQSYAELMAQARKEYDAWVKSNAGMPGQHRDGDRPNSRIVVGKKQRGHPRP